MFNIVIFILFAIITLIQHWIYRAKMLPYIRQFRDTDWWDLTTGPHVFFVVSEYKQYCEQNGKDTRWHRIYSGLTVTAIILIFIVAANYAWT